MLKNIIAKFPGVRQLKNMYDEIFKASTIISILIDQTTRELLKEDKYKDVRNLNRYERKIFSQSGEDGIIREIFDRIGEKNKLFVEFGVSNGLECNSLSLLVGGWTGLWIEGGKENCRFIQNKFASLINSGKLKIKEEFITKENIESIFKNSDLPQEFDLLSIDVDGNDYWIWEAIENYSPRVVVMEYNAALGPWHEWIMKYNPSHIWDGSMYFGASLKSLEVLGEKKGYSLVGCSLSGGNAFFVRKDLVADKFMAPFIAENHFEPPRYYLGMQKGHKVNFGEYEISH